MELSAEQMARIERGATLLDEKRPGWEEGDFFPLDIDSFSKCVLCRVFGDFWVGINQLFGEDYCLDPNAGSDYGFYPHKDDFLDDPEQATELAQAKTNYWLKLIGERLS